MTAPHHDRLGQEELSSLEHQIETGTIYAPLGTFAELVRVYRAATADAGLAARMFRESRIETLEAKNAALLEELERRRPVLAAAAKLADGASPRRDYTKEGVDDYYAVGLDEFYDLREAVADAG